MHQQAVGAALARTKPGAKLCPVSALSLNRTTQEGAWPFYDDDEIQAAVNVLASGRVNYHTGRESWEFEKEFAEWCGTKKAIVLSNGTVALELALMGLRMAPGDEVITTPRTFVASASAFVLHSIRPVFADIDPVSGNITAETIAGVITPKTKAIVPVHLGGWPCEMEAIMALAKEKGIAVIEDCAQAHGAAIKGKSVGSFGHVNAWSFCQDKIMTTGGEGGMLTTDDEEMWNRMWSYKDHGKDYAVYHQKGAPGVFRYLHERWGTNWRITEPQSAIGRIQLRKLPQWLAARTANALRSADALDGLDALEIPMPGPDITHAWYRFYAYIKPEALKDGWSRDRIVGELQDQNPKVFSGSACEIYKERAFARCGLAPEAPLPNAERMGETTIALLTHPTLTPEMVDRTAGALRAKILEATR